MVFKRELVYRKIIRCLPCYVTVMKNAMGREICSFIATVFCLSQHFTVKAMAVAYAFFKRHSTTIAILYQINN